MQLDWYVDFLSPFPYLQLHRFAALPPGTVVTPRPVLFAALLKHWGNKGPADIPQKGRFAIRHAKWQAEREGVALRLPAVHPFDPLRPLRLAIALEARFDVVAEILRFVWGEGRDTDDAANWEELARRLGMSAAQADEAVRQPHVKEALRLNTQSAIEAGVFGVPTVRLGDTLFWGADATDMLVATLADPGLVERLDRDLRSQASA